MSIKELYKDDDYVRNELVEARRLMGLKTTNLDNLIDGVVLLYLHCGNRWRGMALTTLMEITLRGAMKPFV